MTDIAPDTTTTPDTDQQVAPDTTGQGTADSEKGRASRQAAKYRTQLRDTETQRDALAARVDQLEIAAIEAHLPGTLTGKAFWTLHPERDGLIAADGRPDTAAIAVAAAAALEELGIRPLIPIPGQGKQPDTTGPTTGPSWSDIVTGGN